MAGIVILPKKTSYSGDGLDRCADHIRTAQEKAQRSFAEYIETVGGELEKAKRLLADHHAGFGQWVKDEFGWTHQQANNLVRAAATMRLLETTVSSKSLPLPSTESQCRPLASLPAEDVPVVWERICEASDASGKPITAAVVKAVVDELLPPEKKSGKPPKEKPFDGEAAGNRLRDWLRTELDRWPESQRREAAHWIRQIIEKEYGL